MIHTGYLIFFQRCSHQFFAPQKQGRSRICRQTRCLNCSAFNTRVFRRTGAANNARMMMHANEPNGRGKIKPRAHAAMSSAKEITTIKNTGRGDALHYASDATSSPSHLVCQRTLFCNTRWRYGGCDSLSLSRASVTDTCATRSVHAPGGRIRLSEAPPEPLHTPHPLRIVRKNHPLIPRSAAQRLQQPRAL